jgi:hypothetical protein
MDGALGASPDRRLDRDGRRLGGLPDPGGEPCPGERSVDRVDVAILDLGRSDGRGGREPGQVVGRQVAVGGGLVGDAVLQLDLQRTVAAAGRAHRPVLALIGPCSRSLVTRGC